MRHWPQRNFGRFFASRSGTRFRRQHRRQRATSNPLRAMLAFVFGAMLILLGTIMLVTPGPGLVVMAVGAAMIAGESLRVARWLDRLDFVAYSTWKRWRERRG